MMIQSSRFELVLASASPRRRVLLESLIRDFRIDPADIDESVQQHESPLSYVTRISIMKAAAVAERHPQSLILASDTAVIVDDRILGKPIDKAEAGEMLRLLSGRRHEVLSAVTLRSPATNSNTQVSVTGVEFAPLPESWIQAYVASGEPMDKAGAYAVQGGAAAWILRIDGSYTGVVGLPLYETAALLRAAAVIDHGAATLLLNDQQDLGPRAGGDSNPNPRTLPNE